MPAFNLPINSVKRDSQTGFSEKSYQAILADVPATTYRCRIEQDADNARLIIEILDEGERVEANGSITLALGDCIGHEVKLRERTICVNGTEMKELRLCSEPY